MIGGPPGNAIEKVAWALGQDGDGFTADLIRLVARADALNRERLRRAFPIEVMAYELWYATTEPAQLDLRTGRPTGQLACGCVVGAGEPFPLPMRIEHVKHTFGAMLLWELLVRPGGGQPSLEGDPTLAQTRIAYLDALTRAFPELEPPE